MSLFVQPSRRTTAPRSRRDANLAGFGPGFDGRSVPTPYQDHLYGPTGALRVSAVVACVGLRASALAQLPFKAYRDDPGGQSVAVSPQPQLVAAPSSVVVPAVSKIQMSISRDLWGYAIGRVTSFDGAMYPTGVEWICPDQTSHRAVAGGGVDWRIGGQPVDSSLLVHVPSRWVLPGDPVGMCPLENSGLVELAAVAQKFGRDWFHSGAVPSAIIYSDEYLDDDKQQSMLDKIMMRWRSRRPAVLGSGLKYEQVSVNADESQFLATITHLTSDIAVSFQVPPAKVGAAISGAAVTYQNLEMQQQAWMVDGINTDLVVIAESFDRHMRPGVYTRHTTAAFTRSDTLTQYKVGDIGIRNGSIVPDEFRGWLGLPPLPDGAGAKPLAPTPSSSDFGGTK